MRSVTGNFFESKVRLSRITEDGTPAKVNECYVVNALSFTECEARVADNIATDDEYEILTETKAQYKEIFFSDSDDDIFYKVKVDFVTLNEKTGREQHSKVVYLVQGSSTVSAQRNIDEVMSGTMTDYRVLSIQETSIMGYYE